MGYMSLNSVYLTFGSTHVPQDAIPSHPEQCQHAKAALYVWETGKNWNGAVVLPTPGGQGHRDCSLSTGASEGQATPATPSRLGVCGMGLVAAARCRGFAGGWRVLKGR